MRLEREAALLATEVDHSALDRTLCRRPELELDVIAKFQSVQQIQLDYEKARTLLDPDQSLRHGDHCLGTTEPVRRSLHSKGLEGW